MALSSTQRRRPTPNPNPNPAQESLGGFKVLRDGCRSSQSKPAGGAKAHSANDILADQLPDAIRKRHCRLRREPGPRMTEKPALDTYANREPVWYASESDPTALDFNGFCNTQCILEFDAEISHRAVHLCVPKKKLYGSEISLLLVDLGHLSSPHRMRAVGSRFQSN